MDDLLKSCEDMTGVSFNSRLSTRYTDTHLTGPAQNQNQSDTHLTGPAQNQNQPDIHLTGPAQNQNQSDIHLTGPAQNQNQSDTHLTGPAQNQNQSDTHLTGPAQNQSDIQKMDAMMGSCGGNDCHTGASILTYTDTHMEESRNQCQSHLKEVESILDQTGATGAAVQPQLPPLTSAGTQLSGTMAEYQTELMGMLAKLENCTEETGITFDPLEWTYPSLPKGFCQHNTNMNKVTQDRRLTTQGLMESVGNTKTEGLESGRGVDLKPYLGSTFGQFEPQSYQAISTKRHSDELGDCGETYTREPMSIVCEEDTDRGTEGDMMGGQQLETELGGVEVRGGVELRGGQQLETELGGVEVRGGVELRGGQQLETELGGVEVRGGVELRGGQQLETELGGEELRGSVQELGTVLEGCIEEVGRMEKRWDELMGELQALREEKTGTEEGREGGQAAQLRQVLNIEADGRREARMREWQSLRAKRSEEEMRLSSVRLEKQGLQEDMRRLKRRLFSVARECAHNQVILVSQQHEVAQLNKEQMELDTLIIQLTEEVSQLGSTHQTQLSTFQSQLQTPRQTPNPIEELTQSKRTACGDIQQYLQGVLKALEERYEPMLLALLKRRERTSEAQVKARQQARELRARRGPLREEGQRLGLQRACLEERLVLMGDPQERGRRAV
uniref:Uncharacterized protein n=1 Tax=Oncorhynchus tshawytscha TaxID=74940 RepID=A0A8C8IPJ4_ONCTS